VNLKDIKIDSEEFKNKEGKETYTEKEVEDLMNQIKDPVGTFYMFSLPASFLRRKVMKK
jgi:F420-non-reducing hydrogenase small subunit